ncbi:GNAT family N-acetyltransferase [Kitasatospora paranensis]|uniref:GNAT family N-acetyltransferase n=1 Tax=Kitasatospora paranensis TaxID=258053 RepID=A0ABW2FS92_9ACTN
MTSEATATTGTAGAGEAAGAAGAARTTGAAGPAGAPGAVARQPQGGPVRPAVPDDAPELVRLRGLMFAAMRSMVGRDTAGPWQAATEAVLRERLGAAERTLQAFVVDDPDEPGRLASCAVGTLEQRLPAPGHPDGRFGFVFNVCTDPGQRRRGHARACTTALLDWFDGCRVTRIDLHASSGGAGLYRSLGFGEHAIPLSRQRLIED